MTSAAPEQRRDDRPEADASRAEGRRERKKRETRLRISDIATGMFLERGFNAVTIAEIADAADVSVNTVYNYFPTKEDLFFDRAEEIMDRPGATVRNRAPGQSAADALLSRMRQDIEERSLHVGMAEGYDTFIRCIHEAPTLLARMVLMQQRTAERLTGVLRDEVGAEAADPTPELVAQQLVGFSNQLFRRAVWGTTRGDPPEEVARRALTEIDIFRSLVSDALLGYATKPTDPD